MIATLQPPRVWHIAAWPAAPYGDMALSADERTCFLCVAGGVVQVEIASGAIVASFALEANAKLSRHGERALWRNERDKVACVTELPGNTELFSRDAAFPAAMSADGSTVAVMVNETYEIWRLGEAQPSLVLPSSEIWAMWLSPDGSLALTRGYDRSGKRDEPTTLYRTRNGYVVRRDERARVEWAVAWSKRGDRVAFADRSGYLNVWTEHGDAVRGTKTDLEDVHFVTIDGEERVLAAYRKRTELVAPGDPSDAHVVSAKHAITGLELSGQRVIGKGGTIVALPSGDVVRHVEPVFPVKRIAISPRNDRALVERRGAIAVWDLEQWKLVREVDVFRTDDWAGLCAEFLPDGECILLVSEAGEVVVIDETDSILWSAKLAPDPAWGEGWHFVRAWPDITTSAISLFCEWSCPGPVEPDGFQGADWNTKTYAFTFDGERLASAPESTKRDVTVTIDRRAVVVKRGDVVALTLDVTVEHGEPSAAAIARDAGWLLVGTKRGTLLGYR